MIGLIAQNNICRTTLLEILGPLGITVYTPGDTYDMVLMTDKSETDWPTAPVLTLGIKDPRAKWHCDTPIRPTDLYHRTAQILGTLQNRITFENTAFLFRRTNRILTDRQTGEDIMLTEKESDLLAALAEAMPQSLSKDDLLKIVWNYSPDTETHTVESHIYLLRQKLGNRADALIQSTPTGYILTKV